MMERDDDNDLSYGALMMLCEGHGTSKIYERIQAALAAKDQQVAAWQMAYEGLQQQLAAKDEELARLKAERDEYRALNEHHKDEFLRANLKLARLTQARDTLLGEAVWAMDNLNGMADVEFGDDCEICKRAQAFLAHPDVREWQGRQNDVKPFVPRKNWSCEGDFDESKPS